MDEREWDDERCLEGVGLPGRQLECASVGARDVSGNSRARVVVVTGGAKGFGREIVDRFVAAGDSVIDRRRGSW